IQVWILYDLFSTMVSFLTKVGFVLMQQAMDGVRIFHEGLFWRCSFMALHSDFSMWDFWITNQPHSKICQTAFLFPFPVGAPMWVEPHEQPSAIAFRAFWSIFLVTGVTAVLIGGFLVMCAASLASHKLYRIGGAFHACGGKIQPTCQHFKS
uniref:Transmembrane protein 182 n=1 Tax=Nothobranchius furzeri TaxID=105023 RepID=A0A8C6KQP2_NOTFU